MSSHRGRANQSLYSAGILISSWRSALDAGNVPAGALNDAFLPAVHLHLRRAYGWFLLQVSGEGDWSAEPPGRTGELPPVPEGKAVSAEVREFEQLEKGGWLADFLSFRDGAPRAPAARAEVGLSVVALDSNDCNDAMQWKRNFEALFERMSDVIDEC